MSFAHRPNTLLSLWDYALQMPYSIWALMNVSANKCVRTETKRNCQVSYAEYVHQEIGYPNRNTLLQRMADAETRIADVLGYHTGPTCISGETHTLKHWNQQIRLKWDKVIATGKCSYFRLDEGIARTRQFIDTKTNTPVPGADNPFYEVVRFSFEGIQPPVAFDDLPGFHVGKHTDSWNNLFIFERGMGPSDSCDEHTLGHRIRPYECKYDLHRGILFIDIPIQMAAKWDNYGHFVTDTGKLEKIDICDLDNIIPDIEIFQRQICQPAGTALLRPDPCANNCCGDGCCEVCKLREINICLEPVATRSGHFKVIPIINTAVLEDGSPDEDCPCWEKLGFGSCCDYYGVSRSCLAKPIEICVDYIAGCNGCECYINDHCAPHQINDEPCERFKRAIAAFAVAESPRVCECGCLGEFYKYFQKDLREVSATQRFLFRMNQEEFIFGTKQGHVIAWEAIKNLRDARVEIALI